MLLVRSFSVSVIKGGFLSVRQKALVSVSVYDNITNSSHFFFTDLCFCLQPEVQHVVETQPNVHYLIDFADGQDVDIDQVDRFD